MTLPASGPLSLGNIQTEFGGAAPTRLSEYYGAAAGIPGSGAISIGQFHGKSAAPSVYVSLAALDNFYLAATDAPGFFASVSASILSINVISASTNTAVSSGYSGELIGTPWLFGGGAVANYQGMMQFSGSAPDGGPFNTWTSMSTGVGCSLSQSGDGFKSCNVTFSIRRTSDLVVVATANVGMQVQVIQA